MSDSHPAATPPVTRLQWGLLAAILLIAAFTRLIHIGAAEAHYDELINLELSTGRGSAHYNLPMDQLITAPAVTSLTDAPPWYAIFATLHDDPHPPLRSLLLRAWRLIFGESIGTARTLWAVCSILSVVAMFDVMRRLSGTTMALWACLIMALAPAQISAAREVRAYPLLILLSLCAASAMLRIRDSGPSRTRRLALSASIFGMLFTHYFAVPAVAAMALFAILQTRDQQRRAIVSAIVCGGLLFAVAWGPMVLKQGKGFALSAAPGAYQDASKGHIARTFQRAAVAPLGLLFTPGQRESAAVLLLGAAVFLVPLLQLRKSPQLLLWILWLDGVVLFVALVDLAHSTWYLGQPRQTLLAAPAVCAIFAMIGASAQPLLRHLVPGLIVVACVGALSSAYENDNTPLSWLGRQLKDAVGTDDPVVFYADPADTWYSQWLFLAASHYSGAFPRPCLRLTHPASAEQLRQLEPYKKAWLIFARTDLAARQVLPNAEVISIEENPLVCAVARVALTGGEHAAASTTSSSP